MHPKAKPKQEGEKKKSKGREEIYSQAKATKIFSAPKTGGAKKQARAKKNFAADYNTRSRSPA